MAVGRPTLSRERERSANSYRRNIDLYFDKEQNKIDLSPYYNRAPSLQCPTALIMVVLQQMLV